MSFKIQKFVTVRISSPNGSACLVPDILLSSGLKKAPLQGFSHPYHTILKFKAGEELSEGEVRLIKNLSQ